MMHAPAIELSQAEKSIRQVKARKALLWLAIVSVTMLFGAFTSAYIVRQGEGKWVQFDLPQLFVVSTVVIVLSSIPMQWAVVSVKRNNLGNLKTALFLTMVLGAAFVCLQYMAWSELFSQGIAFSGQIKDIKGDYTYVRAGSETDAEIGAMGNVAGSFLYVITALHVVHLLGGMLALTGVLGKAFRGKYTSLNYSGVSMCAIYWHFLDGLWVYLFFFLLYIR